MKLGYLNSEQDSLPVAGGAPAAEYAREGPEKSSGTAKHHVRSPRLSIFKKTL